LLKRILLPVAIIAIGMFILILLVQTKPEKTVKSMPEKVWRVDTFSADFKTLSPQVTLYGRVETPRNSVLKSALNADVVVVSVLEGQIVKKGQLLAQLDDTDAALLLAQREAELIQIQASFNSEQQRYKRDTSLLVQQKELLTITEKAVERAKKLQKSNLLSQASLDDAIANKQRQVVVLRGLEFDISDHSSRLAQIEAQQNRAQVLLEQAKVELSRTKIIAPFDGLVSQLNVSIGDRVRAGDSVLSIYDNSQLEVRAQIPDRYMGQVRTMIDNSTSLVASSGADTLSLNRLSGEVQLNSGGVDGLFRFISDNPTPVLGAFIELELTLSPQEHVLAIPSNALYGLDQVYLINDGYLQSTKVERLGEFKDSDNKKYLIVKSPNIQQGDLIVSTQLPNAITGLRVEAVSE
jgi:multidrug efflux pump subunit AcrA (membrane-fusion protein)